MSIAESDWRKFKALRQIALDRFCQGVLADAKAIAQHGALSAHARYGMLYGLIQDRNKDMYRAFDANSQSRSSALRGLSLMVKHDLLSEAELSVLSEEARDYISEAVRQPYELEWVDEIVICLLQTRPCALPQGARCGVEIGATLGLCSFWRRSCRHQFLLQPNAPFVLAISVPT